MRTAKSVCPAGEKEERLDIHIKDLSKKYDGKCVFSHFSASFREGCCNVVMGPSGCGKTTLLRILMGLEFPDEGIIEGVPAGIAAVFQENRLCEDFSAVTNVKMVLPGKYSGQRIREDLSRVGLEESMDQPVRELSGGMKRRVAIVRAALAEADLLLLDEPFKGLDEITRRKTMDYLKERSAGKTVIIVTHDTEEASYLSENVLHF